MDLRFNNLQDIPFDFDHPVVFPRFKPILRLRGNVFHCTYDLATLIMDYVVIPADDYSCCAVVQKESI